MRFRAFSVATILALGIFTLAAHADTVTYQISFSTSPTTSFPFLDPSSGSFTLVLDPTQTYENATAGLTVNSLVFDPFISESASCLRASITIRVRVISSSVEATPIRLALSARGAQLGAPNRFVSYGSYVRRTGVQSAPQAGDVAFYETGTVNVSPSTSPVPEPSSLLLLGSGLISAVGVARRRRGSN